MGPRAARRGVWFRLPQAHACASDDSLDFFCGALCSPRRFDRTQGTNASAFDRATVSGQHWRRERQQHARIEAPLRQALAERPRSLTIRIAPDGLCATRVARGLSHVAAAHAMARRTLNTFPRPGKPDKEVYHARV